MKKLAITICLFALIVVCLSTTPAQTKKPKKAAAPAPAAATPLPTPQPTAQAPAKKNGRPGGDIPSGNTNSGDAKGSAAPVYIPAYFYEFTRPGFTYSRIVIEHDEAGKGEISFARDGSDELITDPVELTAATLTKINDILSALNFIDSTENYQTDHDFSNMGNVTFTLKKGDRSRTVKYNWTENKNAKALMDEYRRIGNEGTWKFEIAVARQNQPLQTPGIMEALDSYIGRGEISDPPHLIPLLTELSDDERLPLMARNRAAKLVKQLEKAKK